MSPRRGARLLVVLLAGSLLAIVASIVDLRDPSRRLEARFVLAPSTPADVRLVHDGEPLATGSLVEIDGRGRASVPDGIDFERRWVASWQEVFRERLGVPVFVLGGGSGGATGLGGSAVAFSTTWCGARPRRGPPAPVLGYAFRPPRSGTAPAPVGAIVLAAVDGAGRPNAVTGVRETVLGPRRWWERWLRRPEHRIEVELTVEAIDTGR